MKPKVPEFIKNLIERAYGKDAMIKIMEEYSNRRNTTFRVNTLKTNTTQVQDKLKEAGIEYSRASWNENAIVLDEGMEKQLQELDIYKNGEIYLQSLSSMLPPIILEPKPKENILDMCAAPGGKTTQIAAMAGNKAFITACERNTIRVERLKYNIQLQGCKGVSIINRDARDLDDFLKFDKILLDAPCSGSGTIYSGNKNLDKSFTRELINKSVKTQIALIKKAINLLKPGGELVYSTCSILKEENENIINSVLHKGVELMPITIDSSITLLPVSINGTVCVMPCKLYEGFFVAKFKKI